MSGSKAGRLDLLLELQGLDRVPRMGYALRGVSEPESVSEHAFHVVFLVWSLGREVPQLDLLRAVELALVHDLAEVRFGDLPRPAGRYLPDGAKDAAELAAWQEMAAPLGEGAAELLVEYQARETLEARFVGICDKLQILIKASVYEAWGQGAVGEFLDALKTFDDDGFAPVGELVEELRQRRSAR